MARETKEKTRIKAKRKPRGAPASPLADVPGGLGDVDLVGSNLSISPPELDRMKTFIGRRNRETEGVTEDRSREPKSLNFRNVRLQDGSVRKVRIRRNQPLNRGTARENVFSVDYVSPETVSRPGTFPAVEGYVGKAKPYQRVNVDTAQEDIRTGRGAVTKNPLMLMSGTGEGKGLVKYARKVRIPARKPRSGIGFGTAAAGVVGGALLGKYFETTGNTRDENQERLARLKSQARADALAMMQTQEMKAHMQSSIDENLAKLQAQAPEIYMKFAAGRVLPQGAVVIGGVPRQDLLQQLGMSMANGDFNQ